MRVKNISILIIMVMCCFFAFGCTNKASFKENIVLTIDDIEISMDQAKFYAYNKQANYEVYYLVSGQVIDWDAPYDETNEDMADITMEFLVKKEVLEQIKEAVVVSEYAKDEGISLNEDDLNDIDALVEEFRADSKDTLVEKAGKSKAVLTTVFTRQKYVDKLYEKLDITDDAEAQNELYKKLINEAEIELNEELWNTITFDDAIYNADDVEPMSE